MRRPPFVLLLIVLASAGCSDIMSHMMPPQKIPLDRRNYLEYVSTSWKEQLLTNLVMLRYGDTLNSLDLISVTTGYELDAGATAGYTHSWHPVGTGVGFRNGLMVGGSVIHMDKPTITYNPTKGEALAKTLIEPIDPAKILKSLQTFWGGGYIFSCCVKSINELRNRSKSGKVKADDQFFELAPLFNDLKNNGVIRITVETPEQPKVTKVPQEYTITLKDERQETEKNEPGKETALKAATKPKKEEKAEVKTDKKKEKKEDCRDWILSGG